MFKKIFYRILFLFFIFIPQSYGENIFIKVNVDDEIITNIDIKKEVDYLIILNPKLLELDESKKMKLQRNQ